MLGLVAVTHSCPEADEAPGHVVADQLRNDVFMMYTWWPMAALVRKQVYINAAQEQFLKWRAKALGVTEAELIRAAIDALARTPERPPFDPDAWKSVVDSMNERARLPSTGEGRTWTRDDIYEERLGRISR
jgi:hypothetical protein